MRVKYRNPSRQPRLRHHKKFTGGTDSAALHGVIIAMMQAQGRGALSSLAARGGMPVSATRKRLLDPIRAFDEFTFKMVAYVTTHRRDKSPESATLLESKLIGNYRIDLMQVGNEIETFWSVKL